MLNFIEFFKREIDTLVRYSLDATVHFNLIINREAQTYLFFIKCYIAKKIFLQ